MPNLGRILIKAVNHGPAACRRALIKRIVLLHPNRSEQFVQFVNFNVNYTDNIETKSMWFLFYLLKHSQQRDF